MWAITTNIHFLCVLRGRGLQNATGRAFRAMPGGRLEKTGYFETLGIMGNTYPSFC
jgi:hypothetical protein